jgi:hypothetical protein
MNEAAGHLLAAQKIPLGSRRPSDDEADTPTLKAPAPPPVFDPRKLMSGFASRINRS